MFKRSGASYSLWPEQRPRRGRPLKFAAGSFVLGAVCATAYGALFNFTAPATGQGLSAQRVVEPIPIVMEREPPAATAVPAPQPKPADSEGRPGRTRAAAAKVTLPLIGTSSPRPPAATDGRGDDGLAGEVRLTEPEPSSDNVPGLLGDDGERAAQKTPARKPEPTARSKAADPAASVPVPRAALPKTATLTEAEPAKHPPVAKNEPAGEPKTEKAATDKAVPAATADSRTERGVVVLAGREDSITLAGGGDDAQARAPLARDTQSKGGKPPAATEARTERRGVIVLAKREPPVTLAGGDDAPAPAPSAEAKTSRGAAPVADATSPSQRRGVVVLKKRERPTRLARASDAPAPEPVARTSKSTKAKTAAVSERRAKPRKSIARTKPEKPTRYAARSRSTREGSTRRVAGRGHDRLSSMIAQATQAFRAYTGGQGFALPGGF